MKYLSKLSFILVSSILLFSCGEKGSGHVIHVPRNAEGFNQVKLTGNYNLYLRQDTVQKIEVVADDNVAPHILTEVSNNTLTIKRNKHFRKVTTSDVYISVPSLNAITLDGSGRIQGENTFKGSNMTITIKGSGDLGLSYEGSNLSAVIDGSGNMNLSGISDNTNYTISGSGNIDAGGVNAKNTNATVSGSGNITLTATTSLNANISGSGNISYSGSPSTTVHVSGSGSVNKR